MCGTVRKSPHNQVFREVISDHQAVNIVPIEQVSAQSVPCMRWHITHISNWFSCPGTCLTNSTFFHSISNVIGNAWPEYRVSCFEHALFNTPNVHHVFVPVPSSSVWKVWEAWPLLWLVHSPLINLLYSSKTCEALVEASYGHWTIPYECNVSKVWV